MRVLVVDDEVALAQSIVEGLAGEGISAEVCHDGNAGFEAARTGQWDAIILDVLLPGRNGFWVCRDLRAAGVSTPILMLTAKSGEFDEAEGLELGADDYLTKPFSFVVLVARLRALLRRTQSLDESELRCGTLTFDSSQRLCRRAGADIKLTTREAAVLQVLLESHGQVVTKAELAAKVWGSDAGENLVEVYIGYLRRKIDDPFSVASIETVRGLGYRIVAQD